MSLRLLQIVGRDAGDGRGAHDFAGRVAEALGGAVLALPAVVGGGLAALRQALEREPPDAALVHLGLAAPELLMLLRERGVRFAVLLHDFAPVCPTQRLWHRRGERCAGPGRTGCKCAWCVSGGAAGGAAELPRRALELPVRALLYRHRPRTWRTALAGAEALIAPSRFAREFWLQEGAPPERVAVIGTPSGAGGAAAPALPLLSPDAGTAPGGGPPAPPRRIVFAGAWDAAEGAELLAAALEQVSRPVRLEVAGDAAAAARWRTALAAPHTLRMLAPGRRSEWDAATVVAAPARYAPPFSPAVAAAQAAGARAVATAVGGLTEQIVHGVNGFLTEPDDPGALAETLEEALAAPWDGAQVAAGAAAEAAASLKAVGRLMELIAAGAAAPAVMLEQAAWLGLRAAARGETLAEGAREFSAELRLSPLVEDAELAARAQQASRQYRLAMNHALAFLRACGCRRAVVLPADAPGADEAREFLRRWGVETVPETELPDGVLELRRQAAANPAWIRRRFPQLKAYAGVSRDGTETFTDPGD